jgi:hypothetical protein
MIKAKVDVKKLKSSLAQYGSLEKVVEKLRKEKQALENQVNQLKNKTDKLTRNENELTSEIGELKSSIDDGKAELSSLTEKIKQYGPQYTLFCGFMAMLAGSPSVTDSIDTLTDLFGRLKEPGWYLPRDPGELRGVFVRKVMGDYLKSFRCGVCGASFVTNRKPEECVIGGNYCCPACHNWYAVKGDDSFLRAMVSDSKQLEDIRNMEEVLKENEILRPFKTFLEVPCEICHQPIECWDDYNAKLVVQGIGFGHTSCWNSEVGRMIELTRAIRKVREDTN